MTQPDIPDPLDSLVHLSHHLGRDTRLVQPGGGNTSIKVGDALLVKGSGTDLRTIGREGFTRLSLSRLAALRGADAMSDAEMMRFMASCMLAEGPAPSVETPLHSLLPHRVIAHTHDVATMSLTNTGDGTAERLVAELFEGGIVYLPYTRPGFPLARSVSDMVDRIPAGAIGLALAHRLAVPGDLLDLTFEGISALGTVGVSTGITTGLGPAGQVLLVVAMFVGRLGPLALVLALAARTRPVAHRPAVETIRIG